MKLLDLYVSGFGKFHDRTITFEDGLNVIYGKNEAGKSTLHTFIRGMLFGIEKQRGRAGKNDLFRKYLPWENRGGYEGRLRLESGGQIYRIERNFQNGKDFKIINETLGKEVEPTKAFMDQLLCGLSETAYNNTISIGQLKSATDSGMVTELRNYIANLNTSGSIALNITKALAFLKAQRKELESQMVPEAARSYASLVSEIKNIEQEISAPEYANQLKTIQETRNAVKQTIESKQKEREELLQKAAKGEQILAGSQFTDQASISRYLEDAKTAYGEYLKEKQACEGSSGKITAILSFVVFALAAAGSGYCIYNYYWYLSGQDLLPGIIQAVLAVLALFNGIFTVSKNNSHKKALAYSSKLIQEIFSRHLGDGTISDAAMEALEKRMDEYSRLTEALDKSRSAVNALAQEIEELQNRQNDCSEAIEKQQRLQWELEKKLEHLSNCKTQAEALRHVLAENDRLREEITAIDLAQETMTGLSTSIRDSFGLYLNKTASELIDGITGGIYNSMSVDENLNVFMNTRTKLVPIEQVSNGTMDQIYLALRLAAAKLIQHEDNQMPLIFDDSFVLYDEDRLKTALKWLASSFDGQIIMFTCHQREAQMLTANQIPYHLITI